MSHEPLQAAVRAVPFRPFSLVLADGERLAVPVPDCTWLLPRGRIIAWCNPDGHVRFLDISKLLGIEMEVPPS